MGLKSLPVRVGLAAAPEPGGRCESPAGALARSGPAAVAKGETIGLRAQPHRAQTRRSRFRLTAFNSWGKVTPYHVSQLGICLFPTARSPQPRTPRPRHSRPSEGGGSGAPPCAGRGAVPGLAGAGGGGTGPRQGLRAHGGRGGGVARARRAARQA